MVRLALNGEVNVDSSALWRAAQEAWDRLSAIYGPAMARAARNEAGLAEGTYFGWMLEAPGFEPEPISAGRMAGRWPYTAHSLNEMRLADGARQGLLRSLGGGEYVFTEAGRTAARRIFEAAYHSMAPLQPLPAGDLERLAGLLRGIAAASEAAPEPPGKYCLRLSRRIVPSASAPLLAWIDQSLSDLNAYRDDAHMASWQPLGVSGAVWEAFTCLWRGEVRTPDELFARLAFRGHARGDYAEALAELVARAWIVPDGGGYLLAAAGRAVRDQAEQTTDRYFFAPWACLALAERSDLARLLAGLRDGLPPSEVVPA
jgi:hypothetical protein